MHRRESGMRTGLHRLRRRLFEWAESLTHMVRCRCLNLDCADSCAATGRVFRLI